MSSPSTLASMIRAAQRTLPASPLATSSRRTLTSSAPRRADDPTSGVRDYVQSLTSSAASASSSSRTPAFRAGSRSPASPSFAVNSPRAAPNHLGAMRSPSAGPGGVGAGGVARPAANATAKAQAIRMAFHGQHYTPPSLTSPAQISQQTSRARPLLGPPKHIAVQIDQIHRLGLNPAKPSLQDDSYKNPALMTQFVTEMGKIMPRSQTMLTRKSQRRVGKAVRRMRSMGLMPVLARPQF
ncbi:hypothetical protein BDZ90DRAFT_230673 [Jaminaea rosea]|uniref:Small ribosomal subunit protein bS18m n=1 Tax=Jaminaea rosea TaxID=1569628 RepID=A0A316V318_9BASI|nr:hypothetical protein BDZ90DRAFT_230673 [Jaminaea rosea]PWN29835.1 hypothetical protein BDZ90DRAFT_230673 [Jaminaea rosea]